MPRGHAVPGSGIHCKDVLHGSFSTVEAPRWPTESWHASAELRMLGDIFGYSQMVWEIQGIPGILPDGEVLAKRRTGQMSLYLEAASMVGQVDSQRVRSIIRCPPGLDN